MQSNVLKLSSSHLLKRIVALEKKTQFLSQALAIPLPQHREIFPDGVQDVNRGVKA